MDNGAFEPKVDARPDDTAWPQVQWPIDRSIVLHHGNVTLRLASPKDALALFEALDHDACWAHVKGRPESEDDVVQTILDAARMGRWMWIVTKDDEVVGTTSFLEVAAGDARLEIGSTAYAPSAWGTHVNPTCKFLLMGWAFEQGGFGRVQLKTDIRNTRSQQAIHRLGATYEGVLRRYQRRADDTVRDTVVFSVLAEEWPAVKTGLLERLA
jgi:N-acetyltransferase